eukprot:scaffold18567_cov146-Isochrysis_galbana.AAC.2
MASAARNCCLLLDGIARVDMENTTGPAPPRLDKGRRDTAVGHVRGAPDAKVVCPRFVHRDSAQACDTLGAPPTPHRPQKRVGAWSAVVEHAVLPSTCFKNQALS